MRARKTPTSHHKSLCALGVAPTFHHDTPLAFPVVIHELMPNRHPGMTAAQTLLISPAVLPGTASLFLPVGSALRW
jgi:hypothetical protein